jgi:hypothetical protein
VALSESLCMEDLHRESQTVRSAAERRKDALESLAANNHLWIATASPQRPSPHMVPVSYAWTGTMLIVATSTKSPTAENLLASKVARVAVGRTDDVVLIDAILEEAVVVASARPEIADVYANQSDWDPRTGTDLPSHYFVLVPQLIQAWREARELPGRTIMRGGKWLTEA